VVKPLGLDQRAELSPARDEGMSNAGGENITNCVVLDEPPCTDPYARWCERGRLAAAPYSISGLDIVQVVDLQGLLMYNIE
jgi:hypothetical protein